MSRYDAEVYIVKHYAVTLFRLSVFDPDIDPGLAELENNPYKTPDLKKKITKRTKERKHARLDFNTILGCFWFPLAPST